MPLNAQGTRANVIRADVRADVLGVQKMAQRVRNPARRLRADIVAIDRELGRGDAVRGRRQGVDMRMYGTATTRLADVLIRAFEGLRSTDARRVATSAALAGARQLVEPIRGTNVFKDKTGRLRAGVRKAKSHKVRAGRTPAAYVPVVSPYAHLVEYGHGGPAPATPHPFVRRALQRHQAQVSTTVSRRFEELLVKRMLARGLINLRRR